MAPPTGGGLPCVAVASHTYATADSFTRGWACSHTCDHPLRERVSELIFYSSASWKVVANPPQWLKSHCNTGENTGRGCPLAGHTPAPVRAHHRLHAADDGAPHPADWREIEAARCTERGAVHWALYTAAWDRRVAGARVLWRGALGATRSRSSTQACGAYWGGEGGPGGLHRAHCELRMEGWPPPPPPTHTHTPRGGGQWGWDPLPCCGTRGSRSHGLVLGLVTDDWP